MRWEKGSTDDGKKWDEEELLRRFLITLFAGNKLYLVNLINIFYSPLSFRQCFSWRRNKFSLPLFLTTTPDNHALMSIDNRRISRKSFVEFSLGASLKHYGFCFTLSSRSLEKHLAQCIFMSTTEKEKECGKATKKTAFKSMNYCYANLNVRLITMKKLACSSVRKNWWNRHRRWNIFYGV